MTEKTATRVQRLLAKGVPAGEIQMLMGVTASDIALCEKLLKDGDTTPTAFALGCLPQAIVAKIGKGIRELFEAGCETEEICERVGHLIDVVGEHVMREKRMKALQLPTETEAEVL